jgi:hypothetical protein
MSIKPMSAGLLAGLVALAASVMQNPNATPRNFDFSPDKKDFDEKKK